MCVWMKIYISISLANQRSIKSINLVHVIRHSSVIYFIDVLETIYLKYSENALGMPLSYTLPSDIIASNSNSTWDKYRYIQ